MDTNNKTKIERLLAEYGTTKKIREDVVYGVYDGRRQPLLTRLNDFLIDHSSVPLQEKTYFFHLLAVMIDSGIPVMQAMKILAARTQNERFKRVLNTVCYSLIQGKKLSESIARFPDIFGEMEVGIVKAGEEAGNMDKMLFKLSEQLEKTNAIQIKVITAAFYPLTVFVVLIAVAVAMLTFVIPSIVNLLLQGGLKEADLPLATRILITTSNAISGYWWAILMGIAFIYMIFKVYISSENGKFRWDLLKLKFPVAGELNRKVLVMHFISNLGILLEAGLPVVKALTIIAGSLNNQVYKMKVWEVIGRVQQGEKISTCLASSPFLFQETVTQMLSVGEQTASVGLISQKVSTHYDQEIDNSLKRLTSLFEPLVIVLVGVFVAILALAILSPIFKLTSIAGK